MNPEAQMKGSSRSTAVMGNPSAKSPEAPEINMTEEN